MTTIDSPVGPGEEACSVDRSCTGATCGCAERDALERMPTGSRRGPKAAVLAVACALACLAVPFVAAGAATATAALAGVWWLVVGLGVASTVVVGVVVARRRRGGRAC